MAREYKTLAFYPSKSSPGRYYAVKVDENGRLSCDCPIWVYNRRGDRTCSHTERAREEFASQLEHFELVGFMAIESPLIPV